MDLILAVVLAAGGAIYFFMTMDETDNNPMGDPNRDAIDVNIRQALGLPEIATDILYAQAQLETGNFASNVFKQTHSLFNRHKGSGRGYWTGNTYYANSNDADLRIYTDVNQSAQDMAQLLQDPLYSKALAQLQAGSAPTYYNELAKAGYAASLTYAEDLIAKYNALA